MIVKLFFLFAKFPDSNFTAGKTTKLEDMRKYLLIIGVIISISIQAFASKSAIYMDLAKRGRSDKCTTVRRSPMQCPIDVFYDNETHQIEIMGDDEVSAQVFLCDENGNTLDYSPSINVVLDVPSNYNGLLIIRIEGEDWIAIGKIAI